MRHKIIYCYDALCGWCYGFSPVMQRLHEQYADQIDFDVLSAGMIMGVRIGPVSETAAYIKTAYRQVETTSGVKFGEAFFLKILEPGTAIFSSEMPALALTAFRQHLPGQALQFAHALQSALYFKGIDLNILENYRPLAEQFGLAGHDFIQEMQSEECRYQTIQDFQTVANWGIHAYPTVLLKPADDPQYYMIARGYTPFERLEEVIGKVLPSGTE